jgi:hypothetical protein
MKVEEGFISFSINNYPMGSMAKSLLMEAERLSETF